MVMTAVVVCTLAASEVVALVVTAGLAGDLADWSDEVRGRD